MMLRACAVSVLSALIAVPAVAVAEQSPPKPDGIIDLRISEGVHLVDGQWRSCEARIVEADHRSPGPDGKPSGPPIRTHDIAPHAQAVDFDDSAWTMLDPASLEDRQSGGRLSFNWYRLNITIPQTVGSFSTEGAAVYFEIVVDDYAEVWVNGASPLALGQRGGGAIAGWNAPNRVLLTDDAHPGQRFQLAVFAANGPLSDPPANYIWLRSATLDFYKPQSGTQDQAVETRIERLDPDIDQLIAPGTMIERLADGFSFIEGPVWKSEVAVPGGGYLLFSDPNKNVIHRWTHDGEVSIFRTKSGYSGVDIGEYHQPGSNGLALDSDGRLTICEHGNRRVTRLEKNGSLTVLADRFEGKRLNSPNDLVYRSDGALYFTDPPFGLPRTYDDPRKELACSGVFCLYNNTLKLVSTDLKGPNGLAFSPDEKRLYVDNWDEKKKIVVRYDVQPDGGLTNGIVFFDMTNAAGEEALDGLKVDRLGNVYVSGPGGVWILSASGKHLGTICGPELPANLAWGDPDGRSLYMTARSGLYRIRTSIGGGMPR